MLTADAARWPVLHACDAQRFQLVGCSAQLQLSPSATGVISDYAFSGKCAAKPGQTYHFALVLFCLWLQVIPRMSGSWLSVHNNLRSISYNSDTFLYTVVVKIVLPEASSQQNIHRNAFAAGASPRTNCGAYNASLHPLIGWRSEKLSSFPNLLTFTASQFLAHRHAAAVRITVSRR